MIFINLNQTTLGPRLQRTKLKTNCFIDVLWPHRFVCVLQEALKARTDASTPTRKTPSELLLFC